VLRAIRGRPGCQVRRADGGHHARSRCLLNRQSGRPLAAAACLGLSRL